MRFSSTAALRSIALVALLGPACNKSGSGADSAAGGDQPGVDCSALTECSDKLECSGGARCFKLKSCPEFVCASTKQACREECGGADCLVLESHPMLLSCR